MLGGKIQNRPLSARACRRLMRDCLREQHRASEIDEAVVTASWNTALTGACRPPRLQRRPDGSRWEFEVGVIRGLGRHVGCSEAPVKTKNRNSPGRVPGEA